MKRLTPVTTYGDGVLWLTKYMTNHKSILKSNEKIHTPRTDCYDADSYYAALLRDIFVNNCIKQDMTNKLHLQFERSSYMTSLADAQPMNICVYLTSIIQHVY